jgi:hypothetical protein
MHLVFTAQAAKQKRAAEDLRPFERTLYSYLGLTDVRLAINRLDAFRLESDAALDSLGKRFGETEHKLGQEVAAVEDARDAILKNPPWGEGPTPASEQTRQKLLAFGKELAPLVDADEPPESGDLDRLAHIAASYVIKASALGKVAPAQEMAKVEARSARIRQGVEKRRLASSTLSEACSILKGAEEESAGTLQGKTIEELNAQAQAANKHVQEDGLAEELKRLAAVWLSGSAAAGQPSPCPVCHLPLENDVLLGIIHQGQEGPSEQVVALIAERDRLKSKLDSIVTLRERISGQKSAVASCTEVLAQQEMALASELEVGEGADLEAEASRRLEVLDRQQGALKGQIENANQAHRLRQSVLAGLQEEVKLHQLLGQHRRLQARQQELRRGKENLAHLVSLLDTTSKIHGAMDAALLVELKASLPPVDQALSESFVALTQHPAYDRAFVDPALLPKLELRVGSTTDPSGTWDDSVLNGQAASALGLVPYFAFSQLTDMPFEVHVMLLDDPTQSFDRAHIETLVARLAQLGQRVQLVLSSHELTTFMESIPKYFLEASYKTAELTKFSIKDGPTL